MSKIGCYVRVSTTDKQTTRSQRVAIRGWAQSAHVKPDSIRWFEDRQSGATADRPALGQLLRAVERGSVDTVVVYSLSRLARNTRDGLGILADLGQRGVRVVSVSENIDFGNSVGNLIASVLLAVAQFERELIRDRILAGLKATTKKIGRPQNVKKLQKIRALRDSGLSVAEIAGKIQSSKQNVYKALSKTATA